MSTVCLDCGKKRSDGKTFPLCYSCQIKRSNAQPFRREGKRKERKPSSKPPFTVPPQYAAIVFGVCRKTIYTWLDRGKLNGIKENWRRWVKVDEKYKMMEDKKA